MSATAERRAVSVIAPGEVRRRARRAVLAGNPNVGKSSLFNALTGLHQRISNYPGTTVECLSGSFDVQGTRIEVTDLPGAYSLLPRSPDEEVVRDRLLRPVKPGEPPEVVVAVLDATNLERSLFLASQLAELGRPMVAALNQVDLAIERGLTIDADVLSRILGIDVIPTSGRTGQGRAALAAAIAAGGRVPREIVLPFGDDVRAAAEALLPVLAGCPGLAEPTRRGIARMLLSEAEASLVGRAAAEGRSDCADAIRSAREKLAAAGADVEAGTAAARYAAVAAIARDAVTVAGESPNWRTRLDRFLLHPAGGTLALVATFTLVFLALFRGVEPLIGAVEWLIRQAGGLVTSAAGGGLLGDFLAAGVVAGIGNFLVFVPPIGVFFLLLELLDDSGYLARAAFLLDRLMGRFGLPGRAFMPMLSGFACAIPGIMGARTIGNFRDRMVTMLILPLMSCSARLPVYLLVFAVAFAGAGLWTKYALIASMYLVGIAVALLASSVLRRTAFAGGHTPLLLELPPYRAPALGNVLKNVARRTWAFVRGAGPTIFVLSVVLWVLLTFPRDVALSRDYDGEAAPAEAALAAAEAREAPEEEIEEIRARVAAIRDPERAERQEQSYLGRMGRAIEPAIEPLGFDWKIGVGVLGSFAAREVFVSTLGVIHAAGAEADEESETLQESLRAQRWPSGRPVYTPLAGVSLCVFYVLAMQCLSTLAILRRETGGWKWPAGMFAALTVVAYLASLAVYQAGLAMGF